MSHPEEHRIELKLGDHTYRRCVDPEGKSTWWWVLPTDPARGKPVTDEELRQALDYIAAEKIIKADLNAATEEMLKLEMMGCAVKTKTFFEPAPKPAKDNAYYAWFREAIEQASIFTMVKGNIPLVGITTPDLKTILRKIPACDLERRDRRAVAKALRQQADRIDATTQKHSACRVVAENLRLAARRYESGAESL